MYRSTRRHFLGSLGLGLASYWLKVPWAKSLTIRREVTFPRPMTRSEYEVVTSRSHNYRSIEKFNRRMKQNGLILNISIAFSADHAFFDHTFVNEAAYRFWLGKIDLAWVDLSQFETDGFRAKLYQLV